MNKDQIELIVKCAIKESLGVEETEISNDSGLDELGVDSIDIVHMLVILDKELGFNLPPDNFDGIRTVQDIVDSIHTYIQKMD